MGVEEHRPPVWPIIANHQPGLFLAGPIQGARDWQQEATFMINHEYEGEVPLHIFNPRREGHFDTREYDDQVWWEQNHLARAAKNGTWLFWLQGQDRSLSYPAGREYAKTTKKELSMAIGAILLGKYISLAVGIDPAYRNEERYFRSTFKRIGIPIYDTLGETCEAAIRTLEL